MKEVYSQSKLAFHKDKLKSLSEGKVTAPVYVRIKPTNRCDHRCFYCSYDPEFGYILSENKHTQDEIPEKKMLEILDNLKEIGVKAVTYSGGGEPMVHPSIKKILRKTLESKIELSAITNGQKINGEIAELLSGAEWIRVSADYCDEQTFTANRRVPASNFYKMEENLRNFAKIKKDSCVLGISFIITKFNADKVYESAKFFKDLGVNNIRFSPVYIPEGHSLAQGGSVEYHAPIKEKVLEQIKKAEELKSPTFTTYNYYNTDFYSVMGNDRPYKRCFMMETVPVIAANQKVYFCHDKAYSDSGLIGSIKNCSFSDLWFSDATAKRFKEFKPQECCKHHCTADGRNIEIEKMIKDLDNLDKYRPQNEIHKNFI
ncbi:MAG: radical SAM protein [Candidatus Nanoarchaeia archaeon]